MSDVIDLLRLNVQVMNSLVGFDVVIICCSSSKQANYWQKRLEDGRGSILPKESLVLAVQEDWPGGAGNALGTLYAYKNAAALALEKFSFDLSGGLRDNKISVGLYHTAGKGTRLAPLPGAENNNKPGVKLPATVKLANNAVAPITILESVIKQTGCYAKSRIGRLSVFWGDQVFIPTVAVDYPVTHHVDILCSLGPMVTEVEWREKGMEKYGLIARSKNGDAAQVDKVDHATAVQLLAGLGEIESVGVSLGSFSVSWNILDALLREFSSELEKREGKLDSDPHLWMPMSLTKDAYIHLMGQKKISEDESSKHHDRIQKFLQDFQAVEANKKLGVFGAVNVGQNVYWWDYGQLKLYAKNVLLATAQGPESDLMREFFGLADDQIVHSTIQNVDVSGGSCISTSTLGLPNGSGKGNGFVRHSVLAGVRTNEIEADHAVLINVTASKIVAGEGSLVYNVVVQGDEPLIVAPGQVLAGVFSDDGSQLVLKSHLTVDGGKVWETVLESHGNEHSFEQIYNRNQDVCPLTLEQIITDSHDAAWDNVAPESSASAKRLRTEN